MEGVTVADPCGIAQGLQTALPVLSTTVNEVGGPPAICQLSVAFCPGVMLLGDAVKLNVSGTVTVTVAGLEDPPGPVAVREKLVVWLMGTTAEPEGGGGPWSSPSGRGGLNVTEVALVVAHVRVVVWPELREVGLAVNCVICGGAAGPT